MQSIEILQDKLRSFCRDREWEKFHTPKNLAVALSVEASELLEIYQWLSEDESKNLLDNPDKRNSVQEEVADIFLYLLRFCDVNKIDPFKAIEDKVYKNAQKYPVEKSRGNATKYTEL
jgi:NTP pyrophosphatase (non-canonical NTP hydrolase)